MPHFYFQCMGKKEYKKKRDITWRQKEAHNFFRKGEKGHHIINFNSWTCSIIFETPLMKVHNMQSKHLYKATQDCILNFKLLWSKTFGAQAQYNQSSLN